MTGKAKEYWIEKLGLQPHPKEEKGFFRETHRLVQWVNLPYICKWKGNWSKDTIKETTMPNLSAVIHILAMFLRLLLKVEDSPFL